jgi:hypothetical protein
METPMSLSFKPIFEGTQVALKDAPDQANAWFEAQTRLGEGFNSKAAVRQFTAEVDEPAGLGGKDTAPNPVEYVLVALGSCQEITYRLYADALGIPLTGVSVKLRGLVDFARLLCRRLKRQARLPTHRGGGHLGQPSLRRRFAPPQGDGRPPLPGPRHPAQRRAGDA